MFDIKEIAFSKRKSTKRAIARFLYQKNIIISEKDFNTLVRRTQSSGYRSAVKFLSRMFNQSSISLSDKKQLLLQFTIEYNIETYCRQFPSQNKTIERILSGDRTPEDQRFFKETLFSVVKANKIQLQVIDKYLSL